MTYRLGITFGKLCVASATAALVIVQTSHTHANGRKATITGKAALGDWTTDAPGMRRRITTAELPAPYDTKSTDNGPHMTPRPKDAWPKVPEGFKVSLFSSELRNPRAVITAPNGDLFISESGSGRIMVLRDADGNGTPETSSTFAKQLSHPFGMGFYPLGPNPSYFYVANTDSVHRFPYVNGDMVARGPSEVIVDNISGGGKLRGGGHSSRDLTFSKDGKHMYVSVGSRSNVDDSEIERRRACIFEFTPDGKNERMYASGIRNPVGLAIHPQSGELWTSVNERDALGDHLVPDYVTSVKDGGFYGWPWYYMGANQDPRHPGKRPDLKAKVIVPDVLLQSHSASLDMTFYDGSQFPAEFQHDGFAAEHGSWNRARRTGYKVVRIPCRNGKATGEYEDFMTGFVTPDGHVWGRPVGVTVAKDGALIVTDDAASKVWRVSYVGTGQDNLSASGSPAQ